MAFRVRLYAVRHRQFRLYLVDEPHCLPALLFRVLAIAVRRLLSAYRGLETLLNRASGRPNPSRGCS